jgi:hypothetical protein
MADSGSKTKDDSRGQPQVILAIVSAVGQLGLKVVRFDHSHGDAA